ncbi:NADH dehydrogenase [ubiquinone] 1 beta subcomplex subunit 2, mitochondrial-like [Drosophila ficusphila]|uniref:NADH dehydrogenase [ubiquinone] 1 beta subcomplex subunit 2, mitochondrial-like n=1 Tax=Drosophila ficusphila TaxID=30025 RepID=UPI0007E7AFE4|nr:NADH dehydrogenase [ubiquinone] 1 beta subcomplex subunit 2, mitochondrial-like [Drosophila ficusphila]XP_017046550.1 NADH dehydrogenase [ubiquinone] 1 beta subcomplex subunit 2, mitochondrial-like [Drosophila ficusphila]XP_017046551.1 NADH dehydrogenase [ubiquinone] 1 beta subcomplex subunit 2, mitochondrial-like [Drosophila ficusphila]
MNIAMKVGSFRTSIGCLHRLSMTRNIILRESHVVSYRNAPPPHSRATKVGAVTVGGAMWWWVMWHLWHEPDHITGEFDYPNPSKWSNFELGIPKDS